MLFLVAAAMAAPDIVLVLADDLDLESTRHLSRITEMVAAPGATFDNAFVSLSLCCPSRSTILTGLYAHNTGVMSNHAPTGGFLAFQACESRTIATGLDAAGYATGMFGKYLNGYPGPGDRRYVPPGWDTWVVPAGGEPYNQYNYMLNVNGRLEKHGETEEDFLTDVLAGHVESFLRGSGKNPAFAYVAPYSPHAPSTLAPRHVGKVPSLSAARSPNFDEADTSDKPADLRSLPRMKERDLASIDRQYRARVGSMYPVEDLVARLIAVQESRGRLADTWLIFTSDNGFHLGNHRLGKGKESPYEEDLRVPLLVRGPGVKPGTVVSGMVVNTDLSPTIAAMAGIPPMGDVDGRSWLGWLNGSLPAGWRDAFLIERARQPDQEPEARPRKPAKPAYSGIRTATHKYVDYDTGEHELYDLVADPYELENLAGTGHPEEAVLAARLAELRACKGQACVVAENPAPSTEATGR